MLFATAAATPQTTRVSVDSAGLGGNKSSYEAAISADGRYVAFRSYSDNLVPGDANVASDVFVHDRQTGQTTRVSVDSAGMEANSTSYLPSISADGRYVVFSSRATNLVPFDLNSSPDVFLHDRQTGQTSLVSVDSSGAPGNDTSEEGFISADGLSLVFRSKASNLVSGDSNAVLDVFVRDLVAGQTHRVSVDSAGAQGTGHSTTAAISADGRFVAFQSEAADLVAGDLNGLQDVFLHDRQTGVTIRVSVNALGGEGNGDSGAPDVSADGRSVAFDSSAQNLVPNDRNHQDDVFVHDVASGRTALISVDSAGRQGNRGSNDPSISAGGRYVAFRSGATDLEPGDTNGSVDVFVHDFSTGLTGRVNLGPGGAQADDSSYHPSISADGLTVAFESFAGNLVSGDSNSVRDVYVNARAGDGLVLTSSGTCPGPMQFTITNATPADRVALIYGAAGSFTKPAPPCAGMSLDIGAPSLRRMLLADGAGTIDVPLNVPAAACGRTLQAVDLTRCAASNAIVL